MSVIFWFSVELSPNLFSHLIYWVYFREIRNARPNRRWFNSSRSWTNGSSSRPSTSNEYHTVSYHSHTLKISMLYGPYNMDHIKWLLSVSVQATQLSCMSPWQEVISVCRINYYFIWKDHTGFLKCQNYIIFSSWPDLDLL